MMFYIIFPRKVSKNIPFIYKEQFIISRYVVYL